MESLSKVEYDLVTSVLRPLAKFSTNPLRPYDDFAEFWKRDVAVRKAIACEYSDTIRFEVYQNLNYKADCKSVVVVGLYQGAAGFLGEFVNGRWATEKNMCMLSLANRAREQRSMRWTPWLGIREAPSAIIGGIFLAALFVWCGWDDSLTNVKEIWNVEDWKYKFLALTLLILPYVICATLVFSPLYFHWDKHRKDREKMSLALQWIASATAS